MKSIGLLVLSFLIAGTTYPVGEPATAAPVAAGCLAPVGLPEVRPQVVYHKVKVRRPITETVLVPVKTPRKVVRPVYRKLTHVEPYGQALLVPVKVKRRCVRLVYEKRQRTVIESRLTYVPEKCQEVQTRQLYREVKVPPRPVLAYVPVKTTRLETRTVYREERVPVTRLASEIRMVDEEVIDPQTGKPTRVKKPVCAPRQVVETVKRYVPCIETVPVRVTDYRLEERLVPAPTEYVSVWEQVVMTVTRYRCEMRTAPRQITDYVLVPREVSETVTHYELRHGPKTVVDYQLCHEEAIEYVTTYLPQTRTVMREVEVVVPCMGEVVVPGR